MFHSPVVPPTFRNRKHCALYRLHIEISDYASFTCNVRHTPYGYLDIRCPTLRAQCFIQDRCFSLRRRFSRMSFIRPSSRFFQPWNLSLHMWVRITCSCHQIIIFIYM